MIQSLFECLFLTDVVLNASAATEGNNSSLNYIPGAGFLGIVATQYSQFGEDAQTVFHSGKVRFGDGHFVQQDQRSLKVPASYFVAKGASLTSAKEILVHHKISDTLKDELRKTGTQIKQQRNDFIAPNGKSYQVVSSLKDYTIKSAYDRDKRRSEDAKMFGYEWLRSGSKWQFSVDFDNDSKHLAEKVKDALEGEKRLGRSKTAQFGLIMIKHLVDRPIDEMKASVSNEIVLYAESCLVFVNECGMPTLTPTASDFGLAGTVEWEKCQILARNYSPWNQKRFTREADRVCIDKGSVIVIKTEGSVDLAKIQSGVGLYRNEGFGRVIVNPAFLEADENGRSLIHVIQVEENTNNCKSENQTEQNHESLLPVIPPELKNYPLLQYVQVSATKEQSKYKILADVQKFIGKNELNYKRIKASQWGGIRERASRAMSHEELMRLLFGEDAKGKIDADAGYLTHGVAAADWAERKRLDLLKEWIKNKKDNYSCAATIVLTAAMAKKCNANKK